MKKAKIYKPTKTAMQSGMRNTKNWLLEFDTLNTGINPLMGWESSKDTMSEVKLEFSSREQAINYAKKNNINYYVVEPQKRKIIKKTYSDNFLKKKLND
jgi:NADH dehydrogenase (ubiquinone) Fe-S protein 4